MIAVIDYNSGNIRSVMNALQNLKVNFKVTSDPREILQAEKVIFPGQGRACQAKAELEKLKVWKVLPEIKVPFLGICLGMQLLMEHSEEDDTECLNIIPGRVKKFRRNATRRVPVKIPQMGWNNITLTRDDPLCSGILRKSYFYLANSYYVETEPKYTLGVGQYSQAFTAIIRKDNFYGVQFHPEKSGMTGIQLLKNFCDLDLGTLEQNTPTEIIPAIDLIDGKCVRLTQGDYNRKKEYVADPLKMAEQFEKQGASVIHVIDLEGAKTGKLCNAETVLRIAKAVHTPVQTGGGIRTFKDAEMFLKNGVKRIIMSTSALKNSELIKKLVQKFGAERILVSVDAKDGKVAVDGWTAVSTKPVRGFLKELKMLGLTTIIFTDIKQDGMLKGPNFESIRKVQESGLNVIVAGGVSSVEDVKKLKSMGITGVIIGKAIYEGEIDLVEVCKNVKKNMNQNGSWKLVAGSSAAHPQLRTTTPDLPIQNSQHPTPNSKLTKRIIACMDIKDGRIVKGVNYTDLSDAGDPVEAGKFYSDQGIDELVFLDITATIEKRKTLVELVKRISENINIPFTVGGGIKSIEDIRAALTNGADKVAIESAAVTNPELIREAAETFGSQCIVISISPRKSGRKWEVYIKGGRENTGIDVLEFARQMEELGAGELLVNSLDRDGTKSGFDLELLRAMNENVSIPVIASSGAGTKEHFLEAFTVGKCDAALAASLFHFRELEIASLKEYLLKQNVSIRL